MHFAAVAFWFFEAAWFFITQKCIFFPCIDNIQLPSKKWNLEDDSDEEEDNKDNKNVTEATMEIEGVEEIDPLDAYMQVCRCL